MKKYTTRFVLILAVTTLFFSLFGCSNAEHPTAPTESSPLYEIEAGGTFEPGAYIDIADVRIAYNGNDSFAVTNSGSDTIIIVAMVVGVKKDGSYDLISIPAFGGIDEEKYNQDKANNGWAVQQPTNRVNPGYTLNASMRIAELGKDFPSPDIDEDGYYDLVFTISPQKSENGTQVSTDDQKSEIYKLPVNG